MPDITLINPPIGQDAGNHPLPYGLWQLASFVKARGFAPAILDLNFIWRKQHADYDALKMLVLDVDSPTVGFTCMGNNFPNALEFALELKTARPDISIVFGGPHVSLIGEDLLRNYACVDYVVVGEGEQTLAEMLGTSNTEEWNNLPGVLSRNRPLVPRPLMPSFDEIPDLDLDLVPWPSYLEPGIREHFAFPLLAGSGCPFTCTFCSTSVMWERRFRVKSPRRLVCEMQRIAAETGCRRFDLIHDIFTANKRYVGEFCSEAQGKDLRWLCSSRIDGLDAEEIVRISSAGCAGVFFGVESASPTIQKVVGKRLKVDRILPTLETCVKNGVDCVCSTIFGFPQETWADISATAQLCIAARSANVGRANMHLLMALPGTEIFRTAKLAEKIEDRDLQRSSLPIKTDRSVAWIQQHPKLFSAFRWVQHDSISKDEMFSMVSWGSHLATHPESLRHVLQHCNGDIRRAIQVLGRQSSSDDLRESTLEHALQDSLVTGLREIFQEEERLARILKIYRRKYVARDQRLSYWLSLDVTKKYFLYEVAADAVTINIYQLNQQESRQWEAHEGASALTNEDFRTLGACWPVQLICQKPRRQYAVH